MKEDLKKVLCELEERATKDLRKLLDAKSDFTPTEWESAGKVVDAIKDIEKSMKDYLTATAMEEEYGGWDEGESKRGMNYGRRPIMDYYPPEMNYGRHYNRSGMRHGSSYTGEMDNAIANLRNLMNNASSETERMMYQRFIDEAERM